MRALVVSLVLRYIIESKISAQIDHPRPLLQKFRHDPHRLTRRKCDKDDLARAESRGGVWLDRRGNLSAEPGMHFLELLAGSSVRAEPIKLDSRMTQQNLQ